MSDDSNIRHNDSFGVVSLDTARERFRARSGFLPTHKELEDEFSNIRLMLDQGLSSAAEAKLQQVIRNARNEPNLLAHTRIAMSIALEMQGRKHESLEFVLPYESAEARAALDQDIAMETRVQLGVAYNNTGDYPRSIAILNAALKDAIEAKSDQQLGVVYVALSYAYRRLSEHKIARDYLSKALAHNRVTGNWRLLAETYRGMAMADLFESKYEACLENFQHALKLVGDRPALYMLGKIYSDMAGVLWFLKRPQEGIASLEKSISYFEQTEHKSNAASCYNNLGINQFLIGDWDRAQKSYANALDLAAEVDENLGQIAMICDSIAELKMLRGDYEESLNHLEQAIDLSLKSNRAWFLIQVFRTMARLRTALGQHEQAIEAARSSLNYAEQINNEQAAFNARLAMAEAHLRKGDLMECAQELKKVTNETIEATFDLDVMGEAQRLNGLLALKLKNHSLAAHHLSRSVSIFETIGDVYRAARARMELGQAYALHQPERAAENILASSHIFRTLGATPLLTEAEKSLESLDRTKPEQNQEAGVLTQLLTLRMAEASASRELLLVELAAVLHQEMNAKLVIISEPDEENRSRVVVSCGGSSEGAMSIIKKLERQTNEKETKRFSAEQNISLTTLRAPNAKPATLIISPHNASLPSGISLQPLLKIVELGLDVCALRERERAKKGNTEQTRHDDHTLLHGFIHSSPAMTSLVEEIHKIRSSDVTVLVTGESGTGKELVSRAIHTLSSRRDKIFVPFNCTAVPKELSDAHLFGYRRGAFTGATQDSQGVIRAAVGGSLFLDEIGDLSLDVQPKLLRFLQEGEIQTLGEQHPVKVDVRIIAATNTNLEELVSTGRFREDLFYRLNVIHLRVPPLRERRSEIPTMVQYYINHYASRFQKRDIQMTPQTVDLLMVYDWPGNVRQLCNEIQRIVARAEDGTTITPDNLSPELRRVAALQPPQTANVTSMSTIDLQTDGVTLAGAVDDLERKLISDSMKRHNNNISRVSRELGLTRRGLYLKLERLQLRASA